MQDRITVAQTGNVTLVLTPHVMATNKNGKQYRKAIGYWIVAVDGKDVAFYQDSPKRAVRARQEFERQIQKAGKPAPGASTENSTIQPGPRLIQMRQRKIYIGDKILILDGEAKGLTMLICAIAPGQYVAGFVKDLGRVVKVALNNAQIL